MNERGRLDVVGVGIKLVAHVTREAEQTIASAGRVYYLAADTAVAYWIRQVNPVAKPLSSLYAPGKPRLQSYDEMVEAILEALREGERVCAVFYGHPGVFVYPSHRAIQMARDEGFSARMMPGISAEDCLFADLGFDPASSGCTSYEATQFLLRDPVVDQYTALVLWQIGVIGDMSVRDHEPFNRKGVALLINALSRRFPGDHPVAVYQAARWRIGDPQIHWTSLSELDRAPITQLSTLYVPPMSGAPIDQTVIDELGVVVEQTVMWRDRTTR